MAFTDILNLSISASWLILAVIAARLLLKKAPKSLHCALWALVAVRLLCPVSIESSLSLIPSREMIPEDYLVMEGQQHSESVVLDVVTNPAFSDAVEIPLDTTVGRLQMWDMQGTLVWLAGMGLMAIYGAYSYLSLRLRLRFAAAAGEGVFVCDEIDTPFLLGLFRPRIYLPSNLDEETTAHVLAHERAHLARRDHWWKALGFGLLAVHWFNPLMWVAYILLCRDIELACDERVICKLDKPGVRAYAEALAACSVGHRSIAACPLAFGEVGVRGRIQSMLHYKKPGFWMAALAVAVCVLLAAGFLTDPLPPAPALEGIFEENGYHIVQQQPQTLSVMFYKNWLPEAVLNGREHRFDEAPISIWDSETTRLDMTAARMSGDDILLTFAFSYDLPKGGRIYLPFEIRDGEKQWQMEIENGQVMDRTTSHDGVAQISNYGTDTRFSVRVDMDVYRNADAFLAFTITGINCMTYVSEDADIISLIGNRYAVEKCLYSHPNPQYSYQESDIPQYQIGSDLRLYVHQDTILERSYSLGDLEPVELTSEQFDRLFVPDYWLEQEPRAAALRRENASAWICNTAFTSPAVTHLLLHQKNGDVYMVVLAEQGTVITDLFRLEPTEPEELAPETRVYACKNEEGQWEAPLCLYADGTFGYTEAVYSSYLHHGNYAIDGDRLVTKTGDGRYVWYFDVVGETLVFDGEASSPMRFAQGMEPAHRIPDGTVFYFRRSEPEG